jgi:hypothetical protein
MRMIKMVRRASMPRDRNSIAIVIIIVESLILMNRCWIGTPLQYQWFVGNHCLISTVLTILQWFCSFYYTVMTDHGNSM